MLEKDMEVTNERKGIFIHNRFGTPVKSIEELLNIMDVNEKELIEIGLSQLVRKFDIDFFYEKILFEFRNECLRTKYQKTYDVSQNKDKSKVQKEAVLQEVARLVHPYLYAVHGVISDTLHKAVLKQVEVVGVPIEQIALNVYEYVCDLDIMLISRIRYSYKFQEIVESILLGVDNVTEMDTLLTSMQSILKISKQEALYYINKLEGERRFTIQDNCIVFQQFSSKEYIKLHALNFPILALRMQGIKSSEIDQLLNHPRALASRLLFKESCSVETNKIKEWKYRVYLQKYLMNQEQFCFIFDVSPEAFYLINALSKKERIRKQLVMLLKDKTLNKEQHKRVLDVYTNTKK